jgi:hypothetical protein
VSLPKYVIEHFTCWVRAGDRFATFDVARPVDPAQPQVVAIGVERHLDVQVVDAAGKPLPGAPVGVRIDPRRWASAYCGVAGADGCFRIAHVQEIDARRDEHGRRVFWVVPHAVGPALPGVAVDLDALPASPATLR